MPAYNADSVNGRAAKHTVSYHGLSCSTGQPFPLTWLPSPIVGISRPVGFPSGAIFAVRGGVATLTIAQRQTGSLYAIIIGHSRHARPWAASGEQRFHRCGHDCSCHYTPSIIHVCITITLHWNHPRRRALSTLDPLLSTLITDTPQLNESLWHYEIGSLWGGRLSGRILS